jgi:hypothetical protein
MKNTDNQFEDSRPTYEPPRLDVISLRGDEVLAGICKDGIQSGPNSGNCSLPGAIGTCAEPTS